MLDARFGEERKKEIKGEEEITDMGDALNQLKQG